jgi:iron complex outermembrane receptor protein
MRATPNALTQPMNVPTTRRLLASAAVVLATTAGLYGQAAATTTKKPEDVITLSEFQVSDKSPNGYVASETMTGSRVNTKIVDLPYSIVNLTSEFFEDFGIFELDDSLTFIGGFTGLNIGGGFNLRGFSATSQLRDGFYRLGRYGQSNVDRIEIIRGPNAAIYGRASPGGMVNMISKQPKPSEHQEIALTSGTYGISREKLEMTGPLFESKLGKTYYVLTLSQYERRFDGEYAHTRNNEAYGAVKHDFADGSHWMATAEYFMNIRHAPNSSGPLVSVSRTATPDNTATSTAIGYATNLSRVNAFGPNSELNRGSDTFTTSYDRRLGDNWSLRVAGQYFRARRWDYNQNTGWGSITINPATPTNISSARGATPSKGLIMEDGGGVQGDISYHTWLGNHSVESKTLLTFDLNDYYRWDPSWNFAPATNADIVAWNSVRTVALNPDFTPKAPVQYFPKFFTWGQEQITRITRRRTTSVGGNLKEQASFMDGRLLTFAGLRYDAVRFMGFDKFATAFDSFGIPGTKNMVHRMEHQAKPNVGFNYRVGSGLHFYGSYSESYFVDQTANIGTIADPLFKPETAKGYDYGIKGSYLNERLNFTLGGYYITRYNVSVTDAVETTPGNFITVTRPDGDQLVRGWEADLSWRVTEDLTAGGSFANVNSKYTNFGTNFPEAVGRSVNGVTPENGSAYMKYNFSQGMLQGLSANILATYVSSTPSESPTAGDTIGTVGGKRVVTGSTFQWKLRTGSFTVWNVGVHYKFKTSHNLEHTIGLNLNNAFDKQYARTGRTLGDTRTFIVTYTLGHGGHAF